MPLPSPARTVLCLLAACAAVQATPDPVVPDPLTCLDGSVVRSPGDWWHKRRPELLDLFTREMYGASPPKPASPVFEVFDRDEHALGGSATRIQIAIRPGGPQGPRLDLLVFLPNQSRQPVPAILGINFLGNHAIHPDPAIRLTDSWIDAKRNPHAAPGASDDHRANDAQRGTNAAHWPVERILARGFALATIYREDIAADHPPYFATGVHTLYPDWQNRGDNFSTIAAWAWGLSRCLDALEREPRIDSRRVAVFGFSRLGKAALWAAANDTRFALALSNESGSGGAKLFRTATGETIDRLTHVFPHWYAHNFARYSGRDADLPFDQHLLLSLIAPRPLYIASATDDKYSYPPGEFAAARAVSPVYRLLGASPLPDSAMPGENHPLMASVGYHVRPGPHDVTAYDWEQYLEFASRHLLKP